MEDFGRQVAELHAKTQETRYQFLRAELLNCFKALDFGDTEWELGSRDVAEKEVYTTEKGYERIRRFLPGLDSLERRNEIEIKLADLRGTLDNFRLKLGFGLASEACYDI